MLWEWAKMIWPSYSLLLSLAFWEFQFWFPRWRRNVKIYRLLLRFWCPLVRFADVSWNTPFDQMSKLIVCYFDFGVSWFVSLSFHMSFNFDSYWRCCGFGFQIRFVPRHCAITIIFVGFNFKIPTSHVTSWRVWMLRKLVESSLCWLNLSEVGLWLIVDWIYVIHRCTVFHPDDLYVQYIHTSRYVEFICT